MLLIAVENDIKTVRQHRPVGCRTFILWTYPQDVSHLSRARPSYLKML